MLKQTRFVGPALVDNDLVRPAVVADGSNEERGCGCIFLDLPTERSVIDRNPTFSHVHFKIAV